MIKKFEDYINEGFLSKTLGRTKSGEKRLEDKLLPLPEGVYRVNNFPEFCFILDLVRWEFFDDDDDVNIYVNIYRTPFDEDSSEKIESIYYPFEEGKCPQFDKTYYDKNMTAQSHGDMKAIKVIESDEFRESLNETLLSLPKDTWTKEYFEV